MFLRFGTVTIGFAVKFYVKMKVYNFYSRLKLKIFIFRALEAFKGP